MSTAVALDVGRVLSLRGSNGVAIISAFNAAFGDKAENLEARQHGRATMTRLRDGSVLIAGGCWIDGVTRGAAIYAERY